MATSGYSEDLQSQQANAVTIATSAAAAPSSAKAAHFLSEIPPASSSIAASSLSAASKAAQDAHRSQTGANQNPKALALTGAAQHYVTSNIQQPAAQKSNGQSSSPQYIIVTVTGERPVSGSCPHTQSRSRECVFRTSGYYFRLRLYKNKAFTLIKCITGGNGNDTGVLVCLFLVHLFADLFAC